MFILISERIILCKMHGIFTEIGSVMLVYAVLSVLSKEKGKGKKDKEKMDEGWGGSKRRKRKREGGEAAWED